MVETTTPGDAAGQLPNLSHERTAGGKPRVLISGEWTLLPLRGRFDELAMRVKELAADVSMEWDLLGLTRLDTAGALLLWQAWGRQRPPTLRLRAEHELTFADLAVQSTVPAGSKAAQARLSQFGAYLVRFSEHVLGAVRLVGQLALDLLLVLRQPGLIAWREISANVYRTGAQALGITALVGFLVGITLSYLTSKQLRSYGADIFVINILGVSVWRELGPLLAAIIVAGRSGSSMTAQLGVMRVTQELDALSVMGVSHTVRLVLPKVVALAMSMPLVVVWTSAVVLLGGMVAARAQLGIDYVQFLQALPSAVPIANLWLGLSKAVVFGILIALVACHFGLRIEPNTESLAAGTTDSVVISITLVIIVDALFAVLFSDVGL
ncbi:ABC transporter permease [Methylibium sp.]|uniref:ABC transporter permease n=1 Tax=Methylibium sp. TaxID=2067992 RepID=UPI003D10ABE5